MAKHDYKSFILCSGDELGLILTYAQKYNSIIIELK